jgi:hypothetical protein
MSVSSSRTVTLAQAHTRIRHCFNVKRPVFLWGPPGVGKSEVIADITRELGGYMIDLRLGQMDPTDIRGIPFYNKELGKMDWAPPIDLPDEELASQYPIVVLFLDELNSAPPAVQSAAYQLVLDRGVGKYRLPDNVVLVAAGNRESDKGVTYRMPSPLANRFLHLEICVDFESWEIWAVNNKQHQDVVGYISFAKQDLFDHDPRSASRAFATPRSWCFVNDLLQYGEATDDELTDLIAGCVGEGLAIKFMAHRKISSKLPKPVDILAGKATKLDTKEISAMYSLVTSLCYELKYRFEKYGTSDRNKWNKEVDNFFQYMMDNFTTEVVIMGARVALSTYDLPLDHRKLTTFKAFSERFGKYISAVANETKE